MSKSGTLSYECGYRLAQAGLGQSIWVGVGGDQVKGVRFADLLPEFFADPRTHAIVLVGEVGGSEEEECADALVRLGVRKPIYALIAGREAKEGVSMGHAGALVLGDAGTLASKTRRLTRGRRTGVRLDRSDRRGVRYGFRGDAHVATIVIAQRRSRRSNARRLARVLADCRVAAPPRNDGVAQMSRTNFAFSAAAASRNDRSVPVET